MGVVWMVLAFGGGLLLLYVLGSLLLIPLKWIFKLLISSLVGFAVLLVINFIGATFLGFSLPLNAFNALIVGVLGVPGVILLIIFKLFL